jgi:hypothetical protein
MKTKIVLCFLFAALATMGANCVNEDALVSVNFPVGHTFNINPGPTTTFDESKTIVVAEEVPEVYRNKIKNARYYDVRLWVSGAYSGSVTGSAYVNGVKLMDFSGSWADFTTPQSLLGSSPRIILQAAGKAELVRVLAAVTQNPMTILTLRGVGSVSQGPVPAGLSVRIEIDAQADSEI